jgi:hypothetical protein
MFVSAGLSFILYLLVFFRLRGNITVSPGHKIYFHRRPQIKVGRANDGTCIVTDDQRVESHSTRVAKHMLWYPLAYTVIILPIASARFSTFNGASVPFLVTICTAALFMLHGFINTVLFCTTRDILPGSWRQRLGIGMTWNSGRSDSDLSSETNGAWRFTGLMQGPGLSVQEQSPSSLAKIWRRMSRSCTTKLSQALDTAGLVLLRRLSLQTHHSESTMVVNNGLTPMTPIFDNSHFRIQG